MLTGHCLCGAVSYRCAADPLMTLMCHCDDCQRASGSPFSLNVVVPKAALELEGEASLKRYETVGSDTGAKRERAFCATCGSTMFTFLGDMPDLAVLKAGTLDDRSQIVPQVEIWATRAHAWLSADDAERRVLERGLPAS